MQWGRVLLLSMLAISAGYVLGMSSRTDSTAGSTSAPPTSGDGAVFESSNTHEKKGAILLTSDEPRDGDKSEQDRLKDHVPSSSSATAGSAESASESAVELRRVALEEGLGLAPDPTQVTPTDRLVQFMNALEEPVRDGLAFYGVDRLPILGRPSEIRVLMNLYNGVRHGEELGDLKDACWSVQTEIEGYTSSGALDYGAGCGRTTGLRDGRLYVHAEVFDPKLRQIYSHLAVPLPDGSKSGDLQMFSVERKKWERVTSWSWTTISGDEFKRHEEELRRRARESRE